MALPKLVYSIYESSLRRKLNQELLPQHLGLIHDGHRRFAREKGLLSYEVSYRIGMKRFKDCISWCEEFNINYVTSWLLSKENLQRDAEERLAAEQAARAEEDARLRELYPLPEDDEEFDNELSTDLDNINLQERAG